MGEQERTKMKVTSKDKEERLDFFSSLYEKARLAYSAEAERMERRMEQYRGTLSPSEIQKGVLTVRNITYELIESQVSNDIPPPKVDSEVYSERRERSAGAIEHLLSSLRDKLPFEELNDLDERYTYIYGGSVWLAEWDGADGEIKVSCLSPRDFIPQPDVCNIEDMEYCFLRFTAPKEELTRKYGADPEGAELSQESEDTVAITVCFYRGESGEVSRFVFSGGVTLSDEEDIYRRKTEICTRCGFDREGCRCKEPHFRLRNADGEELYGDIHLSDGRLLDKRDGLEYDYNKYTRCFAIAEENIGSYSFYRLTIGSSSSASVSEIEFLAHEGSEPDEEPGTPDTEQPGVTENPGEVTTAPDTDNTGTPGENAGTEEAGGLSDSAIAVIIVASVLIAAAAATGAVLLVRAKKKK